jgi:hypothetical protein
LKEVADVMEYFIAGAAKKLLTKNTEASCTAAE